MLKIKLISKEIYEELKAIFAAHPALCFQNNGYQYIARAVLEANAAPMARITEILKEHIFGFAEFFNFRVDAGNIVLRFDYNWGAADDSRYFKGVGYLPLEQLHHGFPEKLQVPF